jgi:tRNA (mo5U34)-methyltransferase
LEPTTTRQSTRARRAEAEPRIERGRQAVPPVTDAERAVADLLPIEAAAAEAAAVLERVPLWFHTFALGDSRYTPGVARDHRYRIPFLPAELSGARVLDVGTFDGFYGFLAESRGASRVVAVDNEQYVDWVRARWGVELAGGEGFRAIADLLDSRVEYLRLDALQLDRLDERFDLVLCFGILHRVENPLGLLRGLRRRLADGGELLLETYGVGSAAASSGIEVHVPGDVYARDEFVYWGFTDQGLADLARSAGYEIAKTLAEPVIDGHPRILARLTRSA